MKNVKASVKLYNMNQYNKPDKENQDCFYYDGPHSYISKKDGSHFISCTSIIKKYSQEFDDQFWSAYKAFEALLLPDHFAILKKTLLATKKFNPTLVRKVGLEEEEFYAKREEILQEYATKAKVASERGTKIHAEIESTFYKDEPQEMKEYGFKLGGGFTCKRDYYELDLDKGIYPEYLVSVTSSDGLLKVAGQIDLLVKDGNNLYIADWKSNKEIKQKSFYDRGRKSTIRMKAPLQHLDDCNWNHYQLQLSLYGYLLQTINPEFNIKQLKLVHIDHNDKMTEYEVKYLKDDVIKMLQHYKKQLKIKQELEKNQPIKY